MQLLRASDPGFENAFTRIVDDRRESDDDVAKDVRAILADVRRRGDAALAEYSQRFDHHRLAEDGDWRIGADACRAAYETLDPELRAALDLAAERIRAYHAAQLPEDRDYIDAQGVRLGAKWRAVDAAGLYVPGGRAAYPSSLLMNAIPAKVAGVERLVVTTPTPRGDTSPLVLAAAHIAGADAPDLVDHQADVAVVIAYGLILPQPILDTPHNGCLNLHASKLPRWRGAAPIQRAIMAGDTETAVMVMQMEAGLDTGPVCLSEVVAIGPDTTAGALHDELAQHGASLMIRALAAMERGSLDATPQSEAGVTYAKKIEKSESRIDFTHSAADVHNHIRGLSPFPGAWFEAPSAGGSERIKVLRSDLVPEIAGAAGEVLGTDLVIGCGQGAVRLVELQRAGKRPMPASEFMRGFVLPQGTRLT